MNAMQEQASTAAAVAPAAQPASFKVGVKTNRKDPWTYNALRFASEEAAQTYGRDLALRWTAVESWEVHPSNDPPNR